MVQKNKSVLPENSRPRTRLLNSLIWTNWVSKCLGFKGFNKSSSLHFFSVPTLFSSSRLWIFLSLVGFINCISFSFYITCTAILNSFSSTSSSPISILMAGISLEARPWWGNRLLLQLHSLRSFNITIILAIPLALLLLLLMKVNCLFFFFVIYFMELGVFSATQIVLDIGLVAVFLGVLLSLSAGYSTCGLTCNVVPTGRIILKA